jgi:nicotinate-nucleotide adenylyltransferase
MARRIGILGGTFDPIHKGHIDIGTAAESVLDLTHVFVIPANIQPLRQHMHASAFHRFAMIALTVSSRPAWRVSDLELREAGPSYTSSTLKHFHERGYTPEELFFVIGADAFMDIRAWKDYPDILEYSNFAVVSRDGCPVDELPTRLSDLVARMERPPVAPAPKRHPSIILIDARTANVSSTAIRQLRAAGRAITGLVEPGVEQHIEQHGLYTSSTPGRRANDRET